MFAQRKDATQPAPVRPSAPLVNLAKVGRRAIAKALEHSQTVGLSTLVKVTAHRRSELLLNSATALVTLVAVAVGGVRLVEAVSGSASGGPAVRHVRAWRDYASTGIRLGPPTAKVTVVEFSDFRCPFCKAAARDLRKLRDNHATDVAFVYRHFPLHKNSLEAGIAAQCASIQGAFEEMHDVLFAQSDSIGIKHWVAFASEARVSNLDAFRTCLQEPSVHAAVVADSAAAASLKIDGTPAFLINGRLIIGSPGLHGLESAVSSAGSWWKELLRFVEM